MQPRPEQVGLPKRTGFADEQEKRSLESIFGFVKIAQHTPAHTQHHGTVALHQGRKRAFVAPSAELLEQLGVGQSGAGGDLGAAKEMENRSKLPARHDHSPPDSRGGVLEVYCRQRRDFFHYY
jgi:hypothetical protein